MSTRIIVPVKLAGSSREIELSFIHVNSRFPAHYTLCGWRETIGLLRYRNRGAEIQAEWGELISRTPIFSYSALVGHSQ